MKTTLVHTGAACQGNPGPGGYAAIISKDEEEKQIIQGMELETTSGSMEMIALIAALEHVVPGESGGNITIHSPSKYLTDALNRDWPTKWEQNQWMTSRNKMVRNHELWERIVGLARNKPIWWVWSQNNSENPEAAESERIASQMAEEAAGQSNLTGNVNVHVSGISTGNPGPGGWAALIDAGDGHPVTIGGNHPETSSRRMKLMAIMRSLETIMDTPRFRGKRVRVHSRSKYIPETFTSGWIGKWQRNGWTTTRKEPVKNQDLWERIVELCQDRRTNWIWSHRDSAQPEGEVSFASAKRQIEKLTGPIPREDNWT